MNALLVRVGADQSEGGGNFNGPVDSRTMDFAYVPIPETRINREGMARPYTLVTPALLPFGTSLPDRLATACMHLDPDFEHLTYGDQGQRALQIKARLQQGDLIIFYAGLRDVNSSLRLVYAIIGVYVIDAILQASLVPASRWQENAHTRRVLNAEAMDIVVRAKPNVSGRLRKCLPIGSFRSPAARPDGRLSYRVETNLLDAWGGLSIADGFLQRSARLPQFVEAARFYAWFLEHKPSFVMNNN